MNKWVIAGGGVVGFLILNAFLPWWLAVAIIVGIPAAGYFMLDESQRRRLKSQMNRKQLGP